MKILKAVGKLILWIIILFIGILLIQYIFAPIYTFPKPKPFGGDLLFNPYQHADSNFWRKANFQIQSRTWGGVTDGRKNTNFLIDSTYKFLDYDIIGISDYMKINTHGSKNDSWIPIYEHGYSIKKNHHVCIGAKKVNWHDYAFYQSIHHKQYIVDILRPNNDLIIFAHPSWHNAFKPKDFTLLRNYDGIEILNYFRISLPQWDSALSAGNFVIGIGNDDVHDITNPDEVGQFLTMIYSESLHRDSIIQAMKEGKTIAVEVYRPLGETWERRKEKHDDLASLKKAVLKEDTLYACVDKQAREFRFIGQGGQLKKTVEDSDQAFYVIQPEDTYIRTVVIFPNKDRFYLNPVVRYTEQWPTEKDKPEIHLLNTWIYRILMAASFIFIIVNVLYLRSRWKRRK